MEPLARFGKPATRSSIGSWPSRFPVARTARPRATSNSSFAKRCAARPTEPSNIVSVHEVGREHDTVYIVSDLIEGLSLERLAQRPAASRRTKRPRSAARSPSPCTMRTRRGSSIAISSRATS